MHVGNWKDVAGKAVTEAGAGGVTIRVLMGDNVGASNFTTRHFEVAPGGHTPFHAHAWEHEVFVLSGKGKVKRKDGETDVGPGASSSSRPTRSTHSPTRGRRPSPSCAPSRRQRCA